MGSETPPTEETQCPGCEKVLDVGAVEAFMFHGLPVECADCGTGLGVVGYDDADGASPWFDD